MAGCLDNIQIPTCVWFEGGDKRNALASMIAGTLVIRKFSIIIEPALIR